MRPCSVRMHLATAKPIKASFDQLLNPSKLAVARHNLPPAQGIYISAVSCTREEEWEAFYSGKTKHSYHHPNSGDQACSRNRSCSQRVSILRSVIAGLVCENSRPLFNSRVTQCQFQMRERDTRFPSCMYCQSRRRHVLYRGVRSTARPQCVGIASLRACKRLSRISSCFSAGN